jgi:DNA-binding MarR family transcriptional regulator
MVSKTSSKKSPSKAHAASFQLLDSQLCFALYSASLTMTKIYKPLLEQFGLTYPQYLVMLVLWETNELSVSALGERLYLDSGTLTPLLKRMETLGFVQRRRDAADERRVVVSLTPDGAALKQAAVTVPVDLMGTTGCSLGELGELTQRLQALRTSMAAHLNASSA